VEMNHNFKRCHGLGDSKESLSLFFSFHDFLFETCFCDTYSSQMEMNFKKLRF
jgi:hypothetical protein